MILQIWQKTENHPLDRNVIACNHKGLSIKQSRERSHQMLNKQYHVKNSLYETITRVFHHLIIFTKMIITKNLIHVIVLKHSPARKFSGGGLLLHFQEVTEKFATFFLLHVYVGHFHGYKKQYLSEFRIV
jgi:hypothetical protein